MGHLASKTLRAALSNGLEGGRDLLDSGSR